MTHRRRNDPPLSARAAGSLPFFFFGTLIDLDLLRRVTRRVIAEDQAEPAALPGYRRVRAAGKSYPMSVPAANGRLEGIVVGGLDRPAARRLITYEGANYRLSRVVVEARAGNRRPAAAFLDAGRLRPDRRAWDFALWCRRWKRRALRRADRIAGWGGH